MFNVYFEDITVGSVEEFGHKQVTREEIIAFAREFDPQPFHLDEEAAKNSPFGQLCASGWHTCAMTMRMMVDNLLEKRVAGMGSPGLDYLRWRRPVVVGDVLRVRTLVREKGPTPKRPHLGLMKSEIQLFNQQDERVMTMISNVMILRRQAVTP